MRDSEFAAISFLFLQICNKKSGMRSLLASISHNFFFFLSNPTFYRTTEFNNWRHNAALGRGCILLTLYIILLIMLDLLFFVFFFPFFSMIKHRQH